ATLSRLKTARIVAVCDTYPASLKRAANSAPAAKGVDDYRRILDDKETQAVIIATPTHQHHDIAVLVCRRGNNDGLGLLVVQNSSVIVHALCSRSGVGGAFQRSGIGVANRDDPGRFQA